VSVRVQAIAALTRHLAGLQVRISNGIVTRIISPRVFVLSGQGEGSSHGNEVNVLVEDGTTLLRERTPVVVVGIVRTRLGTELAHAQALGTLSPEQLDLLGDRAIVVASVLETPDGVSLLRPALE
jgi:hypothetical protein